MTSIFHDFAAQPKSFSRIEFVAGECRQAVFGPGAATPKPMEILAIFQDRLNLTIEIVPDIQLGRPIALAKASENKIELSQSLVDDIRQDKVEAIFDLLHEIGHIVPRHDAVGGAARMRDRNKSLGYIRESEQGERQASHFARAFLAPLDECRSFSANEIAQTFSLPKNEAELRFKEVQFQIERQNRRPVRLPAALQGRSRSAIAKIGSEQFSNTIKNSLNPYAQLHCEPCQNGTCVRKGLEMVCETCGGTSGCS